MASIHEEISIQARPEDVWAVVGGRLTHHNASLQAFADGAGSRVVWIADLLPDELAGQIRAMIEQGMGVMKRTLER